MTKAEVELQKQYDKTKHFWQSISDEEKAEMEYFTKKFSIGDLLDDMHGYAQQMIETIDLPLTKQNKIANLSVIVGALDFCYQTITMLETYKMFGNSKSQH